MFSQVYVLFSLCISNVPICPQITVHTFSTEGKLTWMIKIDDRLKINPKELALKILICIQLWVFFLEEIIFCSVDCSGKPQRKPKQAHCYLTAELRARHAGPATALQGTTTARLEGSWAGACIKPLHTLSVCI